MAEQKNRRVAKLVKDIDPALWKKFIDGVRRFNEGKVWSKRGPSVGEVLNDLIRAWIDNGYTVHTPTPREHLYTMLKEAIETSQKNIAIYGKPILAREDIDRIVRGVLARAGKVHDQTRQRYRQALLSGFLEEEATIIDGTRIVEYRIPDELDYIR